MTTFLAALRFAPNQEEPLRLLQRARFRTRSDPGAYTLPPFVPLATLTHVPSAAVLDTLRKHHHISLAIPSDYTVCDGEFLAAPPAAIPLPLTGFEALQTELTVTLGATPLHPGTPVVRISWSDNETTPYPLPLHSTAAFWLTVVELQSRVEDRWWSNVHWSIRYSRRTTNRV